MKLVLLALFLFFLNSLVSTQLLSCEYKFTQHDHQYICNLTLNNQQGWNNFTNIPGTHLAGMSNNNVTAVVRAISSRSTNIPTILCTQFVNLTFMDLSLVGIEVLDENSFLNCTNLEVLLLYRNDIQFIADGTFNKVYNMQILDIEYNNIWSLQASVFANLTKLEFLDIGYNPIDSIDSTVFRNTRNLKTLFMRNLKITEVNPQWFENLGNLTALDIAHNELSRPIPPNVFRNLRQLEYLNLAQCRIREMNSEWFRNTTELMVFYMPRNEVQEIPEGIFQGLKNLVLLDIGLNRLNLIPETTFVDLQNIMLLNLDNNQLTFINSQWFSNLTSLTSVFFEFNSINSIPIGTFAAATDLKEISFWANNLRTVKRNSFGNLDSLWYVDFDENNIQSVDERFLMETSELNMLFFMDNVCGSGFFYNFANHRTQYLKQLELCINNFKFNLETRTPISNNFQTFAPAHHPGVFTSINSNAQVHIALTPNNTTLTQMLEIIIGTNNNTRSTVVRNQQEEVVTVSTPNILPRNQWTTFRITWARNVIIVFEENEEFPFMAYTMQELFQVNHIGLKSPQSEASWFLEPIQIPSGNFKN